MKLYYFHGCTFSPDWPAIGESSNEYMQVMASHRVRGALPALALQKSGHIVHGITHAHEITKDSQHPNQRLIIGKLTHRDPVRFSELVLRAKALIDHARRLRIPVLMDYTDDLVGCNDHRSKETLDLLLRADAVVCSSDRLASKVARYLGTKAIVKTIVDPVEGSLKPPRLARDNEPICLLWFGHASNIGAVVQQLDSLESLAQDVSLELEILTKLSIEELFGLQMSLLANSLHLKINFSEWTGPDSLENSLKRTHIAILPVDMTGPKSMASNNRLTEALWGGCFVVASPLDSYKQFSSCTWLGDDIGDGIRWFIENKDKVPQCIHEGQQIISAHYTPQTVAKCWEQTLSSVEPATASNGTIPAFEAYRNCPKLNLGCGNHPLDDYLNIDIISKRAGKSPDIECDIRNLNILPNDFAEEILAVHVVEHFWRWEIASILKEWIRVLQPGGRLILECPNILSACAQLLANSGDNEGPGLEGRSTMWVFYGDPSWQDPLMCHRWGYTPQSLQDLLTEVGLDMACQEPAQFKMKEPRDMRITAVKPDDWTSQRH